MNMINAASTESQNENYLSMGTVSEYITNEKLNVEITIEADLVLPKISEIPVISFEYREFTQDDVDNIISVLFNNKQLYEINDELTKDDIDDKIIYYKKKLSELTGESEISSNNGATSLNPDVVSNIIEQYLELRETAPTESSLIPATFILPANSEGYNLSGQTNASKNERETISIFASFESDIQINYYNPFFLTHSYKEFTETVPEGLTITEQEAIEMAQQLLDNLGETQMQLCSIVADESVLESEARIVNDLETVPYYQLTFIRSINDVPSTYEYRYFTNDENAEMVYYERIYIYIIDKGVAAFEWNSPLVQKEVLNNNVGLLEFDEILQIAIDNMPLMVGEDITEKKDRTVINIDKIRLGYMQVKMKNSRNEFMFIPVWDFFGTSKQHYTETVSGWTIDEDGWLIKDNLAKSYLTINAIDGSVIDRSLGY